MSGAEVQVVLESLLPEGQAPERRVAAMVVAGALLAGVMSTQHGGVELTGSGPLTSLVLGAAAGLDAGRVRELFAACAEGPEVLLDVLTELMVLFAALDRDRSPS